MRVPLLNLLKKFNTFLGLTCAVTGRRRISTWSQAKVTAWACRKVSIWISTSWGLLPPIKLAICMNWIDSSWSVRKVQPISILWKTATSIKLSIETSSMGSTDSTPGWWDLPTWTGDSCCRSPKRRNSRTKRSITTMSNRFRTQFQRLPN